MFSKSKINKTPEKKPDAAQAAAKPAATAASPAAPASSPAPSASAPKAKPSPSVISTDLKVEGNLITSGDIQVEGQIEGDIRAHLLTVGQSAQISGEVIADDIVVHGHVKGRVRGLKVRLTSSAQVEGDIIHKTIAIESGAHFEGSVQRAEDPLKTSSKADS
ncbi:MAG: polymer-forming cytoskeletal protein [Paracoccaceae bacterium]|nr:polymer-forming cytoskeletal protein [Paracoccaceae bacterium]